MESALQEGISPQEILKGGLLEGMDIVAKKWAEGTAFIPEVLISARCMNGAMEILEPYLVKKGKIQWKGGIRNGAGGSA